MKTQVLLFCRLALGAVAALSLATGTAFAQGDPLLSENHYKIYEITGPVPPAVVTGPITLTDQFGTVVISEMVLDKFGIPAAKQLLDGTGELFPIVDPFRHYTWWAFQHSEPVRRVEVLDQFGGYLWRLRDSSYLLAPAGKNQPDIPVGNHYKCYEADDGPVINITVGLVDQVDSSEVVVLVGEYFCNPVEKVFQEEVSPIVDPLVHLACYRVDNSTPYDVTESVVDQFGARPIVLGQNTFLCLPSEKGLVVGTEPSTWGRVKALYR